MNIQETQRGENQLAAGAISLPELVFTALATLAPLTLVAAVMPLHFLVGGAAVPGAYLIAAGVMALFAVGLNTVLKYLRSSGAFYTIIARGLGKTTGTVSAMLAVLAYNALQISTYGVIGTYAASSFASWFGISLPWWSYALVTLVIVGILGYRGITASAKILGVVLILEILALIVLAIVVLAAPEIGAVPGEIYSPGLVLHPSTLAMFALVFGAFMGFESTSIYSEEVRGGARTVRRATYIVVAFIGVFYSLMALIVVTAYGADGITGAAGNDLEGLVTNLFARLTHPWVFEIVNILLILSAFAALLALHNASNRYVYTLGRERILPHVFGRTHSRTYSPWAAGLLQSALGLIVIIVCAVGRIDPYTVLLLVGSALGFLAIIVLWSLCSLASLVYLRRVHPEEGVWRTLIAPGLAWVALTFIAVLVITNFDLFTGGDTTVNVIVWGLAVVAILGGLWRGLYLRRRRPEIYRDMAATTEISVVP
ncbi:amino acid permease-associated region [Leucobacter sp. 7(1)]|uniref:APC family permease n=1 Tax=Leucobacter sp. 7(1) TaxID=1255613 RepID=UPI00097E9F3B|nr:APC family permease [Leucobacter sp. 7(1)]SJN11286.1 amino acid permease-associated region [Leucobacter sp. 7(1)]